MLAALASLNHSFRPISLFGGEDGLKPTSGSPRETVSSIDDCRVFVAGVLEVTRRK